MPANGHQRKRKGDAGMAETEETTGVTEKIRTEVATAKGVPARFLQGATRKELEAFADDLKKSMTNATSDALANTTIGRSTPVQGVSDTREFLQKLNNKIRS